MSKLLTVVVPVYNTEKYLPKCLDSLIVEGFMEQLEVLIVIDGSPDHSLQIAQTYAERYPDTFVVIDKENGGHGSTINKGLELATGKYFKILDSDDWFDRDAFKVFMSKLNDLDVDVIMTDYAFEYVADGSTKIQLLGKVKYDFLSSFGNSDCKGFPRNLCGLAISAYKTQMLYDFGIQLPENKLYSDTYLQIETCINVSKFIFLNLPLYRYLMGRPDQSVSRESWLRNHKDLYDILKLCNESYNIHEDSMEQARSEFIRKSLQSYTSGFFVSFLRESNKVARQYYLELNEFIKTNKIPTKSSIIFLYRFLPLVVFKVVFPIIMKLYSYVIMIRRRISKFRYII